MSWEVDGTRVLLVEDDDVLREAVQLALERYGFRVGVAPDGLAGLRSWQRHGCDLVVLDVMLPLMDGLSVCREIRASSGVPVIMLTARTDPFDVVQGLEAGADDYVTKPFDTMVLVARIRALLRRRDRSGPDAGGPERTTVGDDLVVDRAAMKATRDGVEIPLTPTEFRVLLELSEQPGRTFSRDALLREVWGHPGGGDTRLVDVHVQRLRAKIGKELVETVRGFGYRLRR